MNINVEIINSAIIHDPVQLNSLKEKELVTKMMIRRRLSRSSRILMYLANKCNFTTGNMIYGSAYGELIDTVEILKSIKNNDPVSPTFFQNSVYNTAASYHSIVHENKSEILTLSCGDNTSYNVMQQGALSLLREEEVFVCVVEAMNFEGIEDLNNCKNELEYGVAFTLRKTDKEVNTRVEKKFESGVPSSVLWMKNLYDLCQQNEYTSIISVEL